MLKSNSRLKLKSDKSDTPYTPQQISNALSRLNETLNVLILLDYLTQTDDPSSLLSYGIMPEIRKLIGQCINRIQCAPNSNTEVNPNDFLEKQCRAYFGNPEGLNHIKSESVEETEKLLLHLYMLLEAMLVYKNKEISSTYFTGSNPNDCISEILSDPNIERKALSLRIVSMLLENESTDYRSICNTDFFFPLLDLTMKNPQKSNIKKAVINLMSTIVRRELLSGEKKFDWIESIWSKKWSEFEDLFPQEVVDDDYYLISCSFLEYLAFQVSEHPDIKKRLQALNDRLKISKLNNSRKEQKKIYDLGKIEIQNVHKTENQVFSEYGEISRHVTDQESTISQLKNELEEEKKLYQQSKSKEEKSRSHFLIGLAFSVGFVAILLFGQRKK